MQHGTITSLKQSETITCIICWLKNDEEEEKMILNIMFALACAGVTSSWEVCTCVTCTEWNRQLFYILYTGTNEKERWKKW